MKHTKSISESEKQKKSFKSVKRAPGSLGLELVQNMDQITMDRIGELGIRNAHYNQQFIGKGKSLSELRQTAVAPHDHCIVIAAGPSLKKRDPAKTLLEAGYDGTIVTSESGIWYCLRNGIVPDLIVTLDPHASRVVRWFGDPSLTEEKLKKDDYFSRQDQDFAFRDELKANEEIIKLLDQYGKKMRIALSTSASKAVVDRVLETGMEIFWWNPMYDEPENQNGITRQLFNMNGMPCVNAGGNVGAACWMMAHAVLGKRHVGLVGVDFSYYDGTPYKNTQYYYEAIDLVGEENLDQIFIRVFNPHLETWFFTDPAYMWYRQVFLEMAQDADCTTYNCTEGGILFGDNVKFTPLKEFLKQIEYSRLALGRERC